MPESNAQQSFAKQMSSQQATIARCKQVLIESCDTELRVAGQFYRLAEYHLHKRNFEHTQELVEAAQRAIAVAGKFAKDPVLRAAEVAAMSDLIADLAERLKQQT